MFGFFKRKADPAIDEIRLRLSELGFDATPHGEAVAAGILRAGGTAAEAACHIALTAVASEVQGAGDDIRRLMPVVPHAIEALGTMKRYKDQGLMREEFWREYSAAMWRATKIGPGQIAAVAEILDDPSASQAVAVRRTR